MTGSGRRVVLTAFGVVAAILVAIVSARLSYPRPIRQLTGAILRDDPDPRKQSPIGGAEIFARDGFSTGTVKSDPSGEFALRLRPEVDPGTSITLEIRHPNFEPLTIDKTAADQLYILRLKPLPRAPAEAKTRAELALSSLRVRYAVKAPTTQTIASAARTFEVVNTGNVPCGGSPPCSPDRKWKATVRTESIDAGENNEFRNARISCIAGPCSFTRIENDGSTRPGRTIEVSVRNWSDTTTFLLEAEVVHTMVSDIVRTSHPVIFGPAMSFTLPATAQGPSIEADLDGDNIVFPLGPKLLLSWATCSMKIGPGQTKLYRCELKPGYRFEN